MVSTCAERALQQLRCGAHLPARMQRDGEVHVRDRLEAAVRAEVLLRHRSRLAPGRLGLAALAEVKLRKPEVNQAIVEPEHRADPAHLLDGALRSLERGPHVARAESQQAGRIKECRARDVVGRRQQRRSRR